MLFGASRDHASPSSARVREGLASSRVMRALQRRAGSRSDGGASRDRTGDLLVANQTLSQLSYGPSLIRPRHIRRGCGIELVGLGGVAPPTSPLSGVRSN